MKQVFPMVPAAGGAVVMLVVMFVLFIVLLLLFGHIAYSARQTTFEVSAAGLHISRNLYGRLIPLSELELDQARLINPSVETGFKLKWRTNGIGMPGYMAGWFKLQNGARALAFLTTQNNMVYIPTQKGYCLLLSVAQPDEFISALKGVR
jgi:hypothetical protein